MNYDEIQKACKVGDLEALKSVMESSPSCIDELDSKLGWALLYRSTVYGMLETTESLLKLGADPNVKNRLGQAPLHQSSEKNSLVFTKLLLDYKANPNVQQNDGDTPLHIACSKGHPDIVNILLASKADPNIPNTVLGRTPLHCACEKGNVNVVKLLIQFKAEIFCFDKNCQSPKDLATSSEIINLLENRPSVAFDKKVSVEEEPSSKESTHEPESEKGILSTNRINQPSNFSFGEVRKSALYNWLASNKLDCVFRNLQYNGFDDLDMLIESIQAESPLNEEILKQIGIGKLGHRLRLLSKLEECLISSRYSINNTSNSVWCGASAHKTYAIRSMALKDWLASLNLHYLLNNFTENGFEDMDQLISVMNSSYKLTDNMLQNDLQIKKIGHRHRILSKLNYEKNPAGCKLGIRFDRAEKIVACESCNIY